MNPRSVLPLALILIAAPFFADVKEHPVKFGMLQALLIALISVGGAGGFKEFRKKLENPVFAFFWLGLLLVGFAAPFFLPL